MLAFRSALDAVSPATIFLNNIQQKEDFLSIFGISFNWREVENIYVIGAGKATGGMAEAFEKSILSCPDGQKILEKIEGFANVVEGEVAKTQRIALFEARPAGLNQITANVFEGTTKMLALLEQATERDVVIDLISGGGSALREKLVDGVSIDDFLFVQSFLGSADISQLNSIRKLCSKVKGGALNESTSAGLVVPMILSDVVGDSLDVIASGPWAENKTSPSDVLAFLTSKGLMDKCPKIFKHISSLVGDWSPTLPKDNVHHVIIGSNKIALSAFQNSLEAGDIKVINHGSKLEGNAKEVGACFAKDSQSTEINCSTAHIYGGETTVLLDTSASDRLGGGRNQRIVLSALRELSAEQIKNVIFFSFATDGEDGRGPAPVAGAIAGAELYSKCIEQDLDPEFYLKRCDEYAFFDKVDGHLITGLTGTNVCDLMGFVVFS